MRERLQAAALELFQRNGYEQTTAAQIAAHVGITERTFFRHFPDKREVLFAAEDGVRDAFVAGIRAAPAALRPLDMLVSAYEAFYPVLEAKRAYAKSRQHLIGTTPALHERELAKLAFLARAAAAALREKGVSPVEAELAGEVGMTLIAHATSAWLADDSSGLSQQLGLAREAIGKLIGSRRRTVRA